MHTKGFTLIELMVSVSIFSVIMVMAMGSILSVLEASHKSDSIRITMDNMNYTLEGISRTIRFGTNYVCSTSGTTFLDCASGGGAMTVTVINPDNSVSYITYQKSGTSITKTVTPPNGGLPSVYTLTSPDVTIQNLTFWVTGSDPTDLLQPKVILVIKGTAGNRNNQSTFSLQTAITQRKLDYK